MTEMVRQGVEPRQYPKEADLPGARTMPITGIGELRLHTASGNSYFFSWYGAVLLSVDDDPYGPAAIWVDTGAVRMVQSPGIARLIIRAEATQACQWRRADAPLPNS
jgi:hypothetical protein